MQAMSADPAAKHGSPIAPVLCVDLDGTIIATDLLWESLLEFVKRKPLAFLILPFWILRGRFYLKERLAQEAPVRPENLPYRQNVLDIIKELKQAGACRVVLVTASHITLAREVARHLGIFDEVLATQGGVNLKGKAKARLLQERFGRDFLYIGDSAADLAVWAAARQGVVVGSKALAERAAAVTEVERVAETDAAGWKAYLKGLRLHHWSKNALLLLPLLLAHHWEVAAWSKTIFGMLLFGFAASAIYVVNDLLDLPSDRKHPWKNRRPFAAGRISIARGAAMGMGLLVCAIGIGWFWLGYLFAAAVSGYCLLSIAYSLRFKRKALVDIFVLTSFYGIRIITGAVITRTPLSHWFLIFSMFFFFSLALAKRYSELMHADELVGSGNSGRGYKAVDSTLISTMGVASAFAAILVFSLYTQSPEVTRLYPNPAPLLLICPLLLYWLARVWLRAGRGELNEDPVTLAMRDPMSFKVGFACFLCILLTFLWR
jgi:4-hydroxybenzoate polyprenyltransferase/phosphoglycolate phosphatase-like HAD superfamily hydrolase